MALGVAAVFLSLGEAQVARAALRASGINAIVFDELLGSNMWMQQLAFGGFRLAVPDGDLAAAVAILREIDSRPFRRRDLDRGVGWRWLAAFAGLTLGPVFGWFVVAHRRQRDAFATQFAGLTLSGLLVAGLVVGLTLLEVLIFDLGHPP